MNPAWILKGLMIRPGLLRNKELKSFGSARPASARARPGPVDTSSNYGFNKL